MIQPRRIVALLLTTAVSAQEQLFSIFAEQLHITPTSTSTLPACSKTVCADFTNACGVGYGTCYPVCSGYPTPTITPPACNIKAPPTTTTTAPTASIKPAQQLHVTASSSSTCDQSICVDYINTACGIKYGGCFGLCSGLATPTFNDPGCPTGGVDMGFVTAKKMCGYKCDLYVDHCSQTYGPGCYTSCPDMARPGYTTPYCETSAATTTSVLAMNPFLERS